MLATAYEIGLTTEQFWRATPVEFILMVEGYQRRSRLGGIYFRETYALLYNINRSEKAPAIDPKEVFLLHGEKKPRKSVDRPGYTQKQMEEAARKASNPVWTAELMEHMADRFNQQEAAARAVRDESTIETATPSDL